MVDLATGDFRRFGSTNAWNWQQGSRLQWVGDRHVAFNDYDGKLAGCLFDVESDELTELPASVNIAFRDEYMLTLGYGELSRYTEYGYPGLETDRGAGRISRTDLNDLTVVEIADYDTLCRLCDFGPAARNFHVNHLLPAPGGATFVFLARAWVADRRLDCLVHCDLRTQAIEPIVLLQTISHFDWIDDNRILAWASIDGSPGYYEIDVGGGTLRFLFASNDGHPRSIEDPAFITDIKQHWTETTTTLCLRDAITGRRVDLVTASEPRVLHKGNRCDMHVSLSADRSQFQIDMRNVGGRAVAVGDVPMDLLG